MLLIIALILHDFEYWLTITDFIFALITPRNIKTGPKLQMLSILSRILKKPNIRKKIRSAEKAEDILALLLPSI